MVGNPTKVFLHVFLSGIYTSNCFLLSRLFYYLLMLMCRYAETSSTHLLRYLLRRTQSSTQSGPWPQCLSLLCVCVCVCVYMCVCVCVCVCVGICCEAQAVSLLSIGICCAVLCCAVLCCAVLWLLNVYEGHGTVCGVC